MLRKLLDGHILCGPVMEEGKRGYRFTATGTCDRLLMGVKVVDKFGGGQGGAPSLTDPFDFILQGLALIA